MNREELLEVIKNAKSKREILNKLGFFQNGNGAKKLTLLCEKQDINFNVEFKINVKKNSECNFCKEKIELKKKFCNSSCAAKFNNHNRIMSDETRLKIGLTLKSKYETGELVSSHKKTGKCYNPAFTKITSINYDPINKNYRYNCKYCNSEYFTDKSPCNSRKTCSKECATKSSLNRSYNNGSRKTIYYFNKYINSIVVLESTWELKVAKLLDSKLIRWIRPESLTWIDKKNKERQYYPDFYLNDYNLFLDPKNPYCMKLDKFKMEYIEKKVDIRYGDIKYIIDIINNLKTIKMIGQGGNSLDA
jgi:hypothetical protein